MPISSDDAIQLYADGFTREELLEFANATYKDGTPQHIDIDTPGWKDMRLHRRELVAEARQGYIAREKKKTGRKPSEKMISEYITRQINGVRKALNKKYDNNSALDFLREEYSRAFQPKPDYVLARTRRTEGNRKSKDYEKARYKN